MEAVMVLHYHIIEMTSFSMVLFLLGSLSAGDPWRMPSKVPFGHTSRESWWYFPLS